MNTSQKFQRAIATFFLLIFFPTLVPTSLYASNNGPNAFEAASFEPVDAADMVNLATGDLSYVMPLLNVPSPEGGYPLALSYKAGVAMDQEASWVGMGWSLNPGAINRFVNGYADDMSFGIDHGFVYDKGQELDMYNIGLGANIAGITAGLGAYWGSNRTFGGSVSFGYGPAVGTFTAGSGGTGFNVGYANDFTQEIEGKTIGFSLRSFKKQGATVSTGASSQGMGLNSMSGSATVDDYNINSSEKSFALSYGIGYFYFGHRRVSYNLFKQFTNVYSGGLYADNPFSTSFSFLNKEYTKNFDNSRIVLSDGNMLNFLDDKMLERGNDLFLLPSKDRFFVNAQGISGRISSMFNEEFRLTNNLKSYANLDYNEVAIFGKYNGDVIDYDMKLNSKLFFEFEGQNSSFLRIDKGNIARDLSREATMSGTPSFYAFKFSKTNTSNLYNENVTPDGNTTKVGSRKRTGKYVEALTNQQILSSGASLNFIESKNLNRSNAEIYLPESIGGFKITDIDGKTYHYSLPVINFESWYKNYKTGVNEDDNFYENERNEPYVTDWLLTAVTGPDYVDSNNDNKLDKGDYGYWVELEYGKWSDGYIWQTNSGQDELIKGDMNNPDRSEYYRGRKQVYYLDALKTRTHTAYFVKSLRQDALGKELKMFKSRTTSPESFDKLTNSKVISSNEFQSCKEEYPNDQIWKIHPDMYNLPKTYQSWNVINYKGFRKNYVYRDFPKHYSLKLDKILLVKNDVVNFNKAAGQGLVSQPETEAYSSKTIRAFKITHALFNSSWHDNLDGTYTSNNYPLRKIDVHCSNNVLDVNDLVGVSYKQAIVKEVDLTYDTSYSLKPGSNTSGAANKGSLTLQKLGFLGKECEKYLPDYEFAYKSASTSFDASQEDDWGYHKTNPQAWSLSEIKNPLGSKINIEYEADDYSNVGVMSSRLFSKGIRFAITKNTTTNKLIFKVTRNTHLDDNVIDDFTNFRDYFTVGGKTSLDMFICRKSKYGGDSREARLNLKNVMADVTDVADDYATFELPDSNDYWDFIDQDRYWILNRIFSLDDVRHIGSGNLDGVIMRNSGERKCPSWRNDYDNDDVNFHYKVASTKTPSKGSGGGLRVKSLTVMNNGQVASQQKYYYNSPGFGKNKTDANYVSSGSTSYVPFKYQVVLPYASLLPGANVLYQNVAVQDYGANGKLINTTEYQFNTFGNTADDPNSIFNLGDKLYIKKKQDDKIPFNYVENGGTRNHEVLFKSFKIENWLATIGSLVSVKNYNKENQLLSSKKFNYKTNLDADGTSGVAQESFMTKYTIYRDVTPSNAVSIEYYAMSVGDVKYPSVLASVESQSGGQVVKSYFDKYDFLTGIPLETRTEIVGGKSFKSKSLPAYVKYGKMGSKIDNSTNRNMLSQTAAGYSYIYDPTDPIKPWKETGVGITTWNNDWIYQSVDGSQVAASTDKEKIWRKHKIFVWDGIRDNNGIFQDYNQNVDDDFWTIGVGSQSLKWRQVSEVTGYNHYSVPLEVKNVISDTYVASKMGFSDAKVICEGSAKYNELYYSGLENIDNQGVWLEPGMYLEGIGRDNTKSHTGNYCVTLSSLSKLNIDLIKDGQGHKAGKYKLNVWVHKDNASDARVLVNGAMDIFNGPSKQAGDWILKTHYLTLNGSTAEKVSLTSKAGTTVSYDDIMLRPITSSATGYVYNERDELVFVIGNNGLGSQFWYDKAGRLVKTYVEVFDDQPNGLTGGFKLSSENKMKY
jgi:hypothetical protein